MNLHAARCRGTVAHIDKSAYGTLSFFKIWLDGKEGGLFDKGYHLWGRVNLYLATAHIDGKSVFCNEVFLITFNPCLNHLWSIAESNR